MHVANALHGGVKALVSFSPCFTSCSKALFFCSVFLMRFHGFGLVLLMCCIRFQAFGLVDFGQCLYASIFLLVSLTLGNVCMRAFP